MPCELCDNLHPDRLVAEDELTRVVVILSPLKEGHVLIVPKRHVESLIELTEKESKSMTDFVDKISALLLRLYDDPPILHMNFGKHASQRHIHWHVLPSKGHLRAHVSHYENVSPRSHVMHDDLKTMAQYLRSKLFP